MSYAARDVYYSCMLGKTGIPSCLLICAEIVSAYTSTEGVEARFGLSGQVRVVPAVGASLHNRFYLVAVDF